MTSLMTSDDLSDDLPHQVPPQNLLVTSINGGTGHVDAPIGARVHDLMTTDEL